MAYQLRIAKATGQINEDDLNSFDPRSVELVIAAAIQADRFSAHALDRSDDRRLLFESLPPAVDLKSGDMVMYKNPYGHVWKICEVLRMGFDRFEGRPRVQPLPRGDDTDSDSWGDMGSLRLLRRA